MNERMYKLIMLAEMYKLKGCRGCKTQYLILLIFSLVFNYLLVFIANVQFHQCVFMKQRIITFYQDQHQSNTHWKLLIGCCFEEGAHCGVYLGSARKKKFFQRMIGLCHFYFQGNMGCSYCETLAGVSLLH